MPSDPLKCYRSTGSVTLTGHTVIAREDEAPYAYTCAGVGEEICKAVNSHDALEEENATLRAQLQQAREATEFLSPVFLSAMNDIGRYGF